MGRDAHYKKVPNGVPGLEVRLPLLFSEGVGKGRIDLTQFVGAGRRAMRRSSTAFTHRKGRSQSAGDADLVIWDQDREVSITQSILHDAMDYTPYEGRVVKGWPGGYAAAR